MTPLVLPEQSPAHVRFFNAIFEADRNLGFRIGAEPYHLRFYPDSTPVHPQLYFQVVSSESGNLWVALSDVSYLTGMEEWLGDACLDQVPEEIAAIVLDGYFSAILEHLGGSVGESFEIAAVRSEKPADELEYAMPFSLTNSTGQQTRGMLYFEADWVPTINSLISFLPTTTVDRMDLLRVPTPIELGRSLLTVEELTQLELFDVVIIDQTDYLSKNQVKLTVGDKLQLECGIDNERLVVHEIMPQSSTCLTNANGAPAQLEDVRLPMVFQAGVAQPTIAELRQFAPGDELDMSTPTRKTLEIVVANRPFGTGQLIQCGDRLGVRILTLDSMQKNLLERKSTDFETALESEPELGTTG